jgi:4,5-DOPA dioxygenase extradiol
LRSRNGAFEKRHLADATSAPHLGAMDERAAIRMPVAFLAHGSPMNAIGENRYTESWAQFGNSVPKPRAILVVSAHWFTGATAVTAMARPKTIHDFQGFPKELFAVEYPAPGDTRLAEEVAEIAKPTQVGLDGETWGLDHGTWSVLVHAFPQADVPVVQLSINARWTIDEHLALGAKLAPLRDRGVLILGSGNVVHNLRAIDRSKGDTGFDWAHRFDDATRAVVTERPWDIASLVSHADYSRAVPTPEHFLPLAYVAGLATAEKTPLAPIVDGYAYGALSMTAYASKGGATGA